MDEPTHAASSASAAMAGPTVYAASEAVRERGPLRLLFDRDFGLLTWGKFASVTAVWVHGVVAAIAVYRATGSATAVGLVTAAQFGPQIFLTPISGTWADAGNVKRQLMLGRMLCAVGTCALALWYGLIEPSGWAAASSVVVASMVVGLGFVIGGPAMQSVVPTLVTREELPAAMTLNTAPGTVARFLGPVLGALVVSHHGVIAGFAVAGAGHVLFTVALVGVRVPNHPPRAAGTDYSVRAGVVHVLSDRPLLLFLLAVAATGFGSEPTLTLAPALAADLGGDSALVGVLSAAFGIGAVAGLLVMVVLRGAIPTEWLVVAGLWAMAAGSCLIAASSWVLQTVVGFGLVGAGFSISATAVGIAVQLRVPEVLRGRVMALWLVAFVGSRPIAALIVGAVADAASLRLAAALAAVPPLLALFACRPSRLREGRT